MKTTSLLRVLALSAVACGTSMGSTVDTFTFTQTGWSSLFGSPGTVPTGQGTLTGSFSGTVESNGFIEASDVTSFSAKLEFTSRLFSLYTSIAPLPSGGGPFFSYNLNGGASSLDFATTNGFLGFVCVGAAAPLACSAPNAADVGYAQVGSGTQNQPTITLVSSVTTGPPVSAAPEPTSVAMVAIACGFLCLLRLNERRMGH